MITLYAFGPLWGLPDPSPFVIKTETQLKMSGLAYAKARGDREQVCQMPDVPEVRLGGSYSGLS